ncbi:MAG TPA: hypothetical protein VMJ75_01735 [Candidatus Acidoferrales bacterium]|nr:hypothetical protein [Candidatus Acidoferrales bacterium]
MSDPAMKSVSSRLAEQDDDLVCYRFRCTTIAFARFADLQAAEDPAPQSPGSFWSELKEVFFPPSPPTVPVVRVPPGARLLLMDIPEALRESFGVGRIEEVSLAQVNENDTVRDAVRFSNGCELLVTSLHAGQRVRVLSVTTDDAAPASEMHVHG